MKKILVLAFAVAALTCSAAIDVAFSNVVGVVRVMSTNHYCLVSIPFDQVGLDLADPTITISNLLQTVNFNSSDKVQMYSQDGDVMYTWMLNAKRVWRPVSGTYWDTTQQKQVSYTPSKADLQHMDKGYALRVWRKKPVDAEGNALPFFLIGQYTETHGTRKLAVGTSVRPKKSLVSFPGISDFDLNTIQNGVGPNDEIDIITDTTPILYTPTKDDKGNWVWGHDVETIVQVKNKKGVLVDSVKRTRCTTDTVIARGTGFWYVSRGGTDESQPTIEW